MGNVKSSLYLADFRFRFGPSDWTGHVIWFYLHTGPVVVSVYNWSLVNWEMSLIPYILINFAFGFLPNTRTERTVVLRLCLRVLGLSTMLAGRLFLEFSFARLAF
jgi:hypothetical protein